MFVLTLPLSPCVGAFFSLRNGPLLSANATSLHKSSYTLSPTGNITLNVFEHPVSADVGSWMTWRQPVPWLSTGQSHPWSLLRKEPEKPTATRGAGGQSKYLMFFLATLLCIPSAAAHTS